MSKWSTKKLGEICDVQSGFACAQKYKVDDGVVHLRTHNIDTSGSVNTNLLIKIPDDKVLITPDLKEGDILFNNTNSAELVGKSALVTEPLKFAFSNHITRIRVLEEVLPEYLLYKLMGLFKEKFFENNCTRWIGQAGFNQTQLKNLEIPLPSLEEQKRIVKVLEDKLGKVKEAIALRQDAIVNTEKILSSKLTEIFTEGKEKGWEQKEIQDIARVINGRAYKQTELLNEGKYRVLRVGNFFTNKSWYYSDLELDEDKYCDNGDLLYAWSASFGPRIWEGEKVIYHYHIWKIVPSELISKFYLKYLLDEITEEMREKGGRGATMAHLTKGNFEKVSIPVPDLKTQEKIIKELDELSARAAELRVLQETQLTDLKSLERAYLHEAFNGQLV